MAYYPSSVKNDFTTKVNFSDTILAAHVNDLQGEVTAIEANIGTSVNVGSGWIGAFDQITTNWNTLKDRIANIEYGLNSAYIARVPSGGSTGQVLQKNSGTNYDYSWVTFTGLPSQSTNAGKFLTTDGSSASWSSISQVPSQTGNNGKYLTTDGSSSSWITISQVPSVSGNSGKYLYTDGSTYSWTIVPSSLPSQTGNNGKYLTTDGSSASWTTITAVASVTGNSGKYLYTDGSTTSWQTVAAGSTAPDSFSQFLLAGCQDTTVSKYGISVYGASKYGETPRIAYSVDPMGILALDYRKVYVQWQIPSGNFTAIRLVRNQNSTPEHAEDGVIVWQETTNSNSITRNYFTDGVDNLNINDGRAIIPGRPIYYRFFMFTDSKVWVEAGSTGSIVPSDHGVKTKLVDILPRVFTSVEQSPLAEPNTESDLYRFLDAFSFTLDEALTHLDLLNPDHSLVTTPETLIPLDELNYGLDIEAGLPLRNRKQLSREAIYIYARSGTKIGLTAYITALTGYGTTVTVSPNLLLDVRDSTFYKSIGRWVATNATISSVTEQVPAVVTNAIDNTYTCKIVATGAGSMTLGVSDPIKTGVPLVPGNNYILSAKIKSPTSAGSMTAKLKFFDKDATLIGSQTSGTSVAANNTWKDMSVTKTATKLVTAPVLSATGASGTMTYTTFDVHQFKAGDSVTVTGFSTSGFNVTSQTITAVTDTTFSISGAVTGTTTATETGYATNSQTDASYATLEISWSASGTYYLDMVCLQPGTVASYGEARAIDVFLSPNKSNYVLNPSFETNVTDGWTKTGSATVTQDTDVSPLAYSGSKSAKIVGTGSWTYTTSNMPVTVGRYHTFSMYVKNDAAYSITFIGKDLTGTPTGHQEVFHFPSSASWTRVSATDLIDALGEPNVAYYAVQITGSTGTMHIDCVQFEQGSYATDYFDGSLPQEYGAIWQGTANNSPSHIYYSKNLKMFRLGNTLTDWVPLNAFWQIRSYAGLEYNNLQVQYGGMTNLLIATLLTSFAVFYVLEVLDYLLSILFAVKRSTLNLLLSAPLSVGGFYLLDFWSLKLVVLALASSLVVSLIDKQVNKPMVVQQRRRFDLGI